MHEAERGRRIRRRDDAILHQVIVQTTGDEGGGIAIGSSACADTQQPCTYMIPTAYSKSVLKYMYTGCTWGRCSAMSANLRLWLGLPDSDNGGIGGADHIGINGSDWSGGMHSIIRIMQHAASTWMSSSFTGNIR